MKSKTATVEDYIKGISAEGKEAVTRLCKEIKKNLPKEFNRVMG